VAFVNYISPVKGVKPLLEKSDPSVAANPLIIPSQEVLSRSRVFRGLSAAEETSYNRKFQTIVTG
jgi:spermidine/putrescine transport system substrate-binding protein